MVFDVAVLGLGTMGSFTCLELANRGLSVLGLDRFKPPHSFGSHSGDTRVFRVAYAELPDYVKLAQRAGVLWDRFSEDAGQPLLTRSGMLSMGPPEGELISGIRHSAALHDLRVEALTCEEIRNRYPVFNLPENYVGLFESTAGWIDVEAAIRFALERAGKRGVRLLLDQPAAEWNVDGSEIAIRAGDDTLRAKRLVVMVGAWASGFLPHLPLSVQRKVLIWVAPEHPEDYAPGRFPVFAIADKFFYGFPNVAGHGVKLAIHWDDGERLSDPTQVWPPRSEDIQPVLEMASRFLPALAGPLPNAASRVVDAKTCLYTMTPDEHFIIDRHPEFENVYFAAGFSGHGFKFAPAIAEAMADLVTGREPELPIGFLRLEGRFG